MSAASWFVRARKRMDFPGFLGTLSPAKWLGLPFESDDPSDQARKLLPLLILALIAALCVVALRIDLIRIRYAMASVVERETELLEERRKLIVHRRQLRDPTALAVEAHARGFRPATHVVVLPEPMPMPMGLEPEATLIAIESPSLPDVAAGPPSEAPRGDWQ